MRVRSLLVKAGGAALAAMLGLAAMPSATHAAPITAGDLVIYRAGDGSAALGTAATAVFLDEYTPAGALVQSITVPAAGASSLTATGNSTTEGLITRSQDGSFLSFTGYRKDAGGTAPGSDPSTTTSRVIGSVDLTGVVNTAIAVTDTGATAIRSAASVDGTIDYISTAAGVRYIGTPSGASTSALIDTRNSRQVYLTGNQLIASNGSTAITGKVQSYGTLPTGTTAASPMVVLGTADAVQGFWMTDLTPSVPGDDTIYLLSTLEGLLRKYSFDGTNWNSNGSIAAAGVNDITGALSGGNVTLYTTAPGTLSTLTDTSGYNGALSGSLAAVATAPTNAAFRGLGILGTAVTPEPTTFGLLALGLPLMGLRRRSRKA